MPLAIVIGAAIRFFTTTMTHLLPETTLVYMFTTLKPGASGAHHPLSGIESLHVCCFPGARFSFGHVFFWTKKHPLFPPWLFLSPRSIWLDSQLGLQPSSSESKVLLTNMPTIGLSLIHSRKPITHWFHFPWSCWCFNWWWVYPEQLVLGTQIHWSLVWLGYLILVVAPNSFHLSPYDYITQGPGEYSFESIYTQGTIRQVAQGTNIQRMNIYKLWGCSIDGWTTIQKEPNCPHHQSRPWLCSMVH